MRTNTARIGVAESRPELEEIPEAECLEILDRHTLGRMAIVVDGQPQIFPINYAMSGRIIALRTGAGSKLSYAPTSKVCFEIDEYFANGGWRSVIVQGVYEELHDEDAARALRILTERLSPASGAQRELVALYGELAESLTDAVLEALAT